LDWHSSAITQNLVSQRTVQIYRTPDDIKEGHNRKGPRPRGWKIRFYENFSKGKPDECWEWKGRMYNTGYGELSIANMSYGAHRLAFVLANGKIDPDLLVMHSCDNRKCVNPAHLSQGTDADNIGDAWRKGRLQKGETNGMAKLTEKQVVRIKQEYRSGKSSMAELADAYGVWVPCIWRIVRGLRWKHVP